MEIPVTGFVDFSFYVLIENTSCYIYNVNASCGYQTKTAVNKISYILIKVIRF